MKKKIVSLVLIIAGISFCCNNSGKKEFQRVTGKPGIYFEVTEYDFDSLDYKEDAVYNFEFINNGDQPLLINNVSTSCGCTVSEYSKKPYLSDAKGSIKVKYDTRRSGKFNKTITVFCNAEEKSIELKIKGIVRENKRKTE